MPLFDLCHSADSESLLDTSQTGRSDENHVLYQLEQRVSGNDAVKQEMAVALIAQGVSKEAVCRILHIVAEMLPDNN
jgi:hypothetical protein